MESFLIRNARIVTQDRGRRVLDGSLLVVDGRIAQVRSEGTSTEDESFPVIDFRGDYLLPGLIQTHLHLCQTLFRHQAEGRPLLTWLKERIWPLEAALDEDTLEVSARLGIAECLLGGTTCILDMGTVHHQDIIAEVIQESGIRAAMGKAMMDTGLDVPDGLSESTHDSLSQSADLAEKWHGTMNDRVRYAFAPRFVLACTPDLQREVGRLAQEGGYLIHTHSSEHPQETAAVERIHGLRNVELLDDLGLCGPHSVFAHGVHLADSEVDTLARTQTSICHCPSSNLKLGSGIADWIRLSRAGVNIGLGADGAPCNNRLDAFSEMRLALLLQSPKHGPEQISSQQVLDMATINGAKALGWSSRIGTIEQGKDADLLRLRRDDFRLGWGEPCDLIVTAAARDQVRDVWVQGKRLVCDGALTGWDLERLQRQGRRALERVLSRAGLD